MQWLAGIVLAITQLLGLILVPLGLPGLWIMVGGVLAYGWMTDFRTVTVAMIGGMIGAMVGVPIAIVGSVLGAFLGAFVGAALFEYTVSRRAAVATRAGWGAVLGRAAGAAVKIALGLVIAVIAGFAALS